MIAKETMLLRMLCAVEIRDRILTSRGAHRAQTRRLPQMGDKHVLSNGSARLDYLRRGPKIQGKVTMMAPSIDAGELQIYEQAARWMLRKEDGPLTHAERRRYEAWMKQPRCAEALKRMEAFSEQMEKPWRRRRLAMRLAARYSKPHNAVAFT